MKNFFNQFWVKVVLIGVCFCIVMVSFVTCIPDLDNKDKHKEAESLFFTTNEQFGGFIPMRIYQIYDRDSGVYYAVTESGGITPMYNVDGSLKLVDNGD